MTGEIVSGQPFPKKKKVGYYQISISGIVPFYVVGSGLVLFLLAGRWLRLFHKEVYLQAPRI